MHEGENFAKHREGKVITLLPHTKEVSNRIFFHIIVEERQPSLSYWVFNEIGCFLYAFAGFVNLKIK